MGAIAEAMMEYAQPLLDDTDGSLEQANRAFALAQVCWNLAVMPEDGRDEAINKMQPTLKMDDEEFDEFRRLVIVPMIQRHQGMFPRMHRVNSRHSSEGIRGAQRRAKTPPRAGKYPGTGRNAPCPCKSGRKYKLCCGP